MITFFLDYKITFIFFFIGMFAIVGFMFYQSQVLERLEERTKHFENGLITIERKFS